VFIVTVHVVAEPEQAPLQPENALPAAGTAVSVTRVPLANVWLHPLEPAQLMPAGLEVTVPLPPTVTCSVSFCTTAAKLAPTLSAAFIVTVQVGALPEHAPVQPTKVLPDAGAADSVTTVPRGYEWLHVLEPVQLMPGGFEVTEPAPPTVTWSGSICPACAKWAETFWAALATITQSAVVPEHAPPHPINVWSVAGAALRVTVVPNGNCWVQLLGPTHRSPPGLDVTVPEPPIMATMGAVCADPVAVGFDVPPAPFEENPPPHAARKPATEYTAPKRNIDFIFTAFTAHQRPRSGGGKCSALQCKRSFKPTLQNLNCADLMRRKWIPAEWISSEWTPD